MPLPRELMLGVVRPLLQSHSGHLRCLSMSSARRNVVKELEDRGMVADMTSRALRKHVEQPVTVYLGVDPSAASLHVGNLAALCGLIHFRLHGHNAIALIGGATGAVGDPSGRSTERNALSQAHLNRNIKSITLQLTEILNHGVSFAQARQQRRNTFWVNEPKTGDIKIENNLNWLGSVSLIDFLSTVGKSARVSTMLSRESVKSRLNSASGISFTEFTYQLLQAFDFLTLHQRHNCTIQLGGSDQLGNIVSGIEMILKNHANIVPISKDIELGVGGDQEAPAYGMTMPLLTTASGEKFGKSAGNAIWLDAKMTSPFDFYQFFLRSTDAEVERYLKVFTFIRPIELESILQEHKEHPDQRLAQKLLAAETTELVHGGAGLRQALAATELFYSNDVTSLNTASLVAALDARPDLSSETSSRVPSLLVRLARDDFVNQTFDKLLVSSGLFSSKTQARKAIEAGTIVVNGERVPAKHHQRTITDKDILPGGLIVLKQGKTLHKAVVLE
ncbi:tyrosyl-tRNA synthetase [Microbotryomycetes sp. JL201]|nr:tyrosyl-tRNA synthetase [Microbotryomycetes sp. JL201]